MVKKPFSKMTPEERTNEALKIGREISLTGGLKALKNIREGKVLRKVATLEPKNETRPQGGGRHAYGKTKAEKEVLAFIKQHLDLQMSFRSIANALEKAGYRTHDNKLHWLPMTIRRIAIRNGLYTPE